jgi:oxalate---CoA ligase
MGVGASDRVATVLPGGLEAAFGFLAVASSAVAAPLNPALKLDDFRFYLKDLRASLVVVPPGPLEPVRQAAAELSIPVVELDGDLTLRAVETGRAPVADRPSDPGDVALLLHTSGTTGRSKIVPLTQRNLSGSAYDIAESLRLTPSDRGLTVMPLFHIHGLVAGVLAPLAAGGSSVCLGTFDPQRFCDHLDETTWYTAVPTLHQAALNAHRASGGGPTSLRFLRSCSSALPPSLMRALEEHFEVPVVEAYGMTEASHQIASNPLPPGRRKSGSVGLPTGSTRVRLLDARGQEVAPGARGEVCLRGANLTAGYEDIDANIKAFTDGWLRTGDEGFFDEDGYLYLTGRLKELINRGGEKIAPREVEEALLSHPDVAAAVAFAVAHPRLGEEVGAAVVLQPGATPAAGAIVRHAREQLPHFKVPRYLRLLPELPKGATGKVQRIGLAERLGVDGAAPDAMERTPSREPATPVEASIAGLFGSLLGAEHVGADDDILALGGDSISATLAAARIRSLHNVELPAADILDLGTPARIAQRIVTLQAQRSRRPSGPAAPTTAPG